MCRRNNLTRFLKHIGFEVVNTRGCDNYHHMLLAVQSQRFLLGDANSCVLDNICMLANFAIRRYLGPTLIILVMAVCSGKASYKT